MSKERRFAIVIGINDYRNIPLNFCVNDATSVRQVLIDRCRFNPDDIFLLTSSKGESITEVTGKYKEALRIINENFKEHEDSILFYFAGHGNYKEDKSNVFFHDSVYPIKEIHNEISALKPKVQTYIIDSCNSGGKVLTRSQETFLPQEYLIGKYIENSDGAMLLYACGSNQKARETEEMQHGLLTFELLNVLNNDALYDEDGILTPSIIQDNVLKQTSKNSNFEQVPVVENRISGIYPFATITKEEKVSTGEVESAEKVEHTIERQEPIIKDEEKSLPKKVESPENKLKMSHDKVSRLKLQKYIDKILTKKLDEGIGQFSLIKPQYSISSLNDINDLSFEGVDKLIEKLVLNAKEKNILPLNEIFATLKRVNKRYYTDQFSSLFRAFASQEPQHVIEYTIDSSNEYIKTNLKIFSSNDILSISFGYGYIIYQSRWGIIVTTIIFKIDWDGEKDNIVKTINQNDYSFLIQDETYQTIEKMEFKEFSLSRTISKWNEERKNEIEKFIRVSTSSTKKL